MFIIFVGVNYLDGTLTPLWALYILFFGFLSGLIIAVLIWYTVSLPLIKRCKRKGGGKLAS